MNTAYGDKLLYCDGSSHDSTWCQCRSHCSICMDQNYSLPAGYNGKSILIYCVLSFNINFVFGLWVSIPEEMKH